MGATQINMQLMTERTCPLARMQHAKPCACGHAKPELEASLNVGHM
jgi:hypothetical protein